MTEEKKGFWEPRDDRTVKKLDNTIDETPASSEICDDDAEEILNSKKVAWVKRQEQNRDHHCHWPGCTKKVPPAMWGCYRH